MPSGEKITSVTFSESVRFFNTTVGAGVVSQRVMDDFVNIYLDGGCIVFVQVVDGVAKRAHVPLSVVKVFEVSNER